MSKAELPPEQAARHLAGFGLKQTDPQRLVQVADALSRQRSYHRRPPTNPRSWYCQRISCGCSLVGRRKGLGKMIQGELVFNRDDLRFVGMLGNREA